VPLLGASTFPARLLNSGAHFSASAEGLFLVLPSESQSSAALVGRSCVNRRQLEVERPDMPERGRFELHHDVALEASMFEAEIA
jgi:hypothetical protein